MYLFLVISHLFVVCGHFASYSSDFPSAFLFVFVLHFMVIWYFFLYHFIISLSFFSVIFCKLSLFA